MNTFYQMWGVTTPEEAQAKIEEQKAEALQQLNGREPQNLEEQAVTLVGKDIFEKLIKEYTEKQWGRKCTELPAFIIKRLPVRLVYDNNYFNDKYQGIPIGGYNKLIDGLLEGVETMTDVDFFKNSLSDIAALSTHISAISAISAGQPIKDAWREVAFKLVFCGALDEFFDYRLGKLDWRTVRFETEVKDMPNYQGNAVVNYTSHDEPYTRVIEHKHFEMFGQEVYDCPQTVISREYSTEYTEGMEPYYPVNDDRNNTLAAQYKALAHQEGILFPEDLTLPSGESKSLPYGGRLEGAVIFGGRLAEYKYYDMAPIIEKVLNINNL